MATFAIHRTALLSYLSTHALETLPGSGYLKHATQEAFSADIYYARQPALLVSEPAKLLKSEILSQAINEHASAAEWLTDTASRLPLGDIISARASTAAASEDGLQASILLELVQTKPKKTTLSPGQSFAGTYLNLGS